MEDEQKEMKSQMKSMQENMEEIKNLAVATNAQSSSSSNRNYAAASGPVRNVGPGLNLTAGNEVSPAAQQRGCDTLDPKVAEVMLQGAQWDSTKLTKRTLRE